MLSSIGHYVGAFLGALVFEPAASVVDVSEKCRILELPSSFGATETSKLYGACIYPKFRLVTVRWRDNYISLKRQQPKIIIFDALFEAPYQTRS